MLCIDTLSYHLVQARVSTLTPASRKEADKSALDLRDVPVDHYDLKLRQPRERREQR